MSRLTEWVDIQRRLVAHGSTVSYLRLKGPDDSTWGTWPITTENLADTITATLVLISEELPKGRHACMLRAYDEAGGEVSVLPQSVEGKSAAATSAAAEQLTLQKATSAAIYNANVLNEGLRKQIEHLNESIATLSENNVTLIDQLQRIAAENADRDIRDMRKDALNDALMALCRSAEKHAEPLLEMVVARWESHKKMLPAPAPESAQPAPQDTKRTTTEPTSDAKPEAPTPAEPSNGAHRNGPDEPPGNPTDDRPRSARSGSDRTARIGPRGHAARPAVAKARPRQR